MDLKKINITTIVLLVLIIVLVASIFYITFVLTSEKPTEQSTASAIVPRKTKASNTTYKKFLSVNLPTNTPIPIPTEPEPDTQVQSETSEEPTVTEDPTQIGGNTEFELTPTPTEIILAYEEIQAINSPLPSASEVTLTPTRAQEIPDAGFIQNVLIMFAVAGLFIFFAFLF